MDSGVGEHGPLRWAWAQRTAPGQERCGDSLVIARLESEILVAVIDGLGHGEEANHAARAVAGTLEEHAELELCSLFAACHATARTSRGVALTAMRVEPAARRLTWLGVGNVEAWVQRAGAGKRERLMLRGGVVGYRLPELRAMSLPLGSGDTLVAHTDGVKPDDTSTVASVPPQTLAAAAMLRTANDDALIWVGRLE